MVTLREGESFENLFRRFKKQSADAGILQDYKKHLEYISPSLKKKLKHKNALKRLKKKKIFQDWDEPL